jgi:hypothetical protein
MGLLDLPSPVLSWIDERLTGLLPTTAALLLWAAVGAFLSMELYRLTSPQKRMTVIRRALDRTRSYVAHFDGPFEEAWPHIRHMLSLALRRVVMVLPATILASLPLLVVIVWLDSRYGDAFPSPGEPVSVTAPGGFQGHWVDGAPPRAQVVDAKGAAVADVPVAAPAPVIHKRRWWNTLVGNPAGYLPDGAPVDRIDIALPRQQFLAIGPRWMRGWEVTFFTALFIFALTLKTVRRIE